jgi:hypothetical protein
MRGHAVLRLTVHRRPRGLLLPLSLLVVLVAAAATFVSYVLWPTWPKAATSVEAPALPVTIAGVLFNVPPGAMRAAVQRHPGTHERIDLVFLWPSLAPPPADGEAGIAAVEPAVSSTSDASPMPNGGDRLFVTIAGLGTMLAPVDRLRTIYPRYFETQAAAAQDGLAILPFRAGTPYEGEDLVYVAEKPDQFFARCTRPVSTVPSTCIHERLLDAAAITLRFPREWLEDWRGVAAGFDRLVGELHPQSG